MLWPGVCDSWQKISVHSVLKSGLTYLHLHFGDVVGRPSLVQPGTEVAIVVNATLHEDL
jgi:hypothetical protein